MLKRVATIALAMTFVGYAVDAGCAAVWHEWRGWAAPVPHALGAGAFSAFFYAFQHRYAGRRSRRRVG